MSGFQRAAFLILVLCALVSCVREPTRIPVPTPFPTAIVAASKTEPTPTPCPPAKDMPQIAGLTACGEMNAQGALLKSRYRNAAGVEIATFDPLDLVHNHQIIWHWDRMNAAEKDLALRWILDPSQTQYVNFENRENWVIDALTKWVPKLDHLALPAEPELAIHWQADGPPMNQNSIYEGLSRIKSLALVRERRSCNYAHSHLGLIEYGGETILFTAPGWRTVSPKSREIFTTVWTIKEAMVIYYAQFLGLPNACPSELEHLKVEYYSTLWLIQVERALAQFVPADSKYWVETEIPFQIRNVKTQSFPQCLPIWSSVPATMPSSTPCSTLP